MKELKKVEFTMDFSATQDAETALRNQLRAAFGSTLDINLDGSLSDDRNWLRYSPGLNEIGIDFIMNFEQLKLLFAWVLFQETKRGKVQD